MFYFLEEESMIRSLPKLSGVRDDGSKQQNRAVTGGTNDDIPTSIICSSLVVNILLDWQILRLRCRLMYAIK